MLIFHPAWQTLGAVLLVLVIGTVLHSIIAKDAPEEAEFEEKEPEKTFWTAYDPETEVGSLAYMVDRLATFYTSDYVTINQSWLRDIPFEQWRDRQLAAKGMTL